VGIHVETLSVQDVVVGDRCAKFYVTSRSDNFKGDFNIIRRKEDKNNDNFNPHWPFIFNAIIDSLDLRELGLSGRQFTWASRR
jgi:hypothetical protein